MGLAGLEGARPAPGASPARVRRPPPARPRAPAGRRWSPGTS